MNVMGIAALTTAAIMLVSCGPDASTDALTSQAVTPAGQEVPAEAFGSVQQTELDGYLSKIADSQPAFDGLPNPALTSCGLAANVRFCSYEQLSFLRDWKAAYAGDYQAQRDVAFCQAQRCEGVVSNKVQACAWRAVIVQSGGPKVTDLDIGSLETECGGLSPAGREAAVAQAERIQQAIRAAA